MSAYFFYCNSQLKYLSLITVLIKNKRFILSHLNLNVKSNFNASHIARN